MRLTIICDDNTVVIDGVARTVDLSEFEFGNLHAVHWRDAKGTEQLKNGTVRTFHEIEKYAGVIQKFQSAAPIPVLPTGDIAEDVRRQYLSIISAGQMG